MRIPSQSGGGGGGGGGWNFFLGIGIFLGVLELSADIWGVESPNPQLIRLCFCTLSEIAAKVFARIVI